MRHPIKIVKGWSKSSKRYALVSVSLTAWFIYREDGFSFSNLTGFWAAPLLTLLLSPITFFVLAFMADLVHSFIHWLEDDTTSN